MNLSPEWHLPWEARYSRSLISTMARCYVNTSSIDWVSSSIYIDNGHEGLAIRGLNRPLFLESLPDLTDVLLIKDVGSRAGY